MMENKKNILGPLDLFYTHNPFYLISAGLVLYGLKIICSDGSSDDFNAWSLMGALCAYTFLMAVTGYLVVKFGKVWEDARSILLILLFLFLAISVSFDEMFNTVPVTAIGLLIFGFCFATLISEGLIRGLSIRFPALLRIPYYAILALFFIYPNWVSMEVTKLSQKVLDWRIFLFPTVAGAVFLGLIPAIRKGSAYLQENGTPWKWPWFPWTVFVFLALSVCFRSYVLSLSFQPAQGLESAFGLYYLVPFFFVILLLVLEAGLVEKRAGLQRFVMTIAPGLIAMAVPMNMGTKAYDEFLNMFMQSAGSPVFLTVVALICFYGYAWFRGAKLSEFGFISMLSYASIVDAGTIDLKTLASPQWWPFAVLAGVQLIFAMIHRDSLRCFLAAICLIAVPTVAMWNSWFTSNGGAVPVHLVLISMMLIGLLFQDPMAVILRRIASGMLVLLSLAVLFLQNFIVDTDSARVVYIVSLTFIAFGYWFILRDRYCLYAAMANLLCSCSAAVWSFYGMLARVLGTKGLLPLIWGVISFVVAAIISAIKAGFFRKPYSKVPSSDTMSQQGPIE